jgi:RNA recognition motif-containing protein
MIYLKTDGVDSQVEEHKIRLFVGNLAWDIIEDEIFNHCGKHGKYNYLFQSPFILYIILSLFAFIYYRGNC